VVGFVLKFRCCELRTKRNEAEVKASPKLVSMVLRTVILESALAYLVFTKNLFQGTFYS
jgi:hypothetical protein